MNKSLANFRTLAASGALALAVVAGPAPLAHAVGEGPNYDGNGQITTSKLATYEQMVSFLKDQDARQPAMELEVIGQTVKGRDIHLVKYISDPAKPTILYLTQQHGNEQLTTEGAMEFIKHLGTGKSADILKGVNILVVPMLNADGAMGDVNFSLENYLAKGDRNLTRYNAEGVDLNRDHVAKVQPETQALHNNVMRKYRIDYMIDLHHQGTRAERDGKLVSGSILYPTTPNADPAVVEKSKQLGAVVFNNVDSTGWGHLGKYQGGSAETIRQRHLRGVRHRHPALRDARHVGPLFGRLCTRTAQQRLPDQADCHHADLHGRSHRGRVHCRRRHLLLEHTRRTDVPPRRGG